MFYVSRPTLENLRKTGNDGRTTYELLKITVEKFLAKIPPHTAYDDEFIIETNLFGEKNPTHYATICYPFDIQGEVDDKYGVVIHIGEASNNQISEDSIRLPKISGRSEYHTMFDQELQGKLEKTKLKGKVFVCRRFI